MLYLLFNYIIIMLMIHHNKLVAKSNFIYDADMPHAHVYIRHVYITLHVVLVVSGWYEFRSQYD